MSPFAWFPVRFQAVLITADLLTVVSDGNDRDFKRSVATQVVACDISKAFDKVWHVGLLHKLKSYGISVQIDSLISSFDRSLHKNIQLILGFLKAPFLVQHFSYYTLMTFLMMLSVVLLSVLIYYSLLLSVIRYLISVAATRTGF